MLLGQSLRRRRVSGHTVLFRTIPQRPGLQVPCEPDLFWAMLNCRCSCRSLQGDPGMAGPTSAPRRRAAPLLWLEDRGAPCHRVRVPEPEGARDVDSGSVAPAQYRQREEAPHLRKECCTIHLNLRSG